MSEAERQRTRVGAYALATDDAGRILLCRTAPSVLPKQLWMLPGGGLDFGEAPEAAVVRELEEEAGLGGEVVRLLDVSDRTWPTSDDGVRTHAIRIIYEVRITGGELRDEQHGSTDTCALVHDGRGRGRSISRELAAHALALAPDWDRVGTAPCIARSGSTSPRRPSSCSTSPTTSSAGNGCSRTTSGSRARERRPDGSLVADFVARRPLIAVLGLGLPVAWRSRTWSEPATRRLRFVHVAGATRGMDVTWRIEPTAGGCRVDIEHDFAPRVPVLATVVDRWFTRPIAGRTLATFKALAEALTEPERSGAPSATNPPA